MEPSVREATVEDARAIAEAHMRGWQVAYEGIVAADYLDGFDLGRRTENWRQNLTETTLPDGTPSPTNLVVEADGRVVGIACVGVWRDDPSPTEGELWAMYVHPDSWGTGAGYALMQATMRELRERDLTRGHLWVLEDNDLARRFYERQGWSATDHTKDFELAGDTILERQYSIDVLPI